MKNTVFKERHEAMGGKMVPFAGFYMPIQFAGINIEHQNVREKLGVFDVSHMGEIWVEGPKAFELVQKVSSNDIGVLSEGKVQYTCFPNDQGGIVDDFLVYHFSHEKYLLVVNASNIEKDFNWLNEQNKEIGATITNVSDDIAQLAVQGPLALKAMQKLTQEPIEDMPFYTYKVIEFAGVKDVLLSTTGYTGAGGCEIYFPNEQALKVFDAVFEAGEEFGVMPIGLAARDTLRLEMGFCLYGNDIDDTTSPLEAGLGWITKFSEGNNFINREELEKQKKHGVQKKLIGFELLDKGVARQHYPIVDKDGNTIGEVTSGTMSPTLKKAIGMGYVKSEFADNGTEIFIDVRGKALKALVVKRPFK
jgi:aminomethyltransferase